ncbi:MAG: branched-chain amino acid ABC transporter permease [Hydrogenophaga sp.]|uniref:branched-chain amino acid ABC transporter permease n=1 Tax=Hydrogenophaga sp. TaxID=1904254 RepID=UPI0026254692|nr:branched-chain amino acid ABC transporter permease [Hydrogenophaga sp.]MDM7943372.1 branched-chain amino acid ABC transporter permease [Hydrogenophaga sp.]
MNHQPNRKLPARLTLVSMLVLMSIALTLPMLAKGFLLFQITLVMIYAIAILGLNLLVGFSGQLSLGHGAFFAVGAYTAAILMGTYDLPYGIAIPAAGAVAFIFGFLFGLPALRLEGVYLAMATFSLAVAMPQVLKMSALEQWTGGSQGLAVARPQAPAGLPLNEDQWLYYIALGTVLLLFLAARNLINSRSGLALLAVKENPVAAKAMGVDIAMYKTLAFGLSAAFNGIAGALSAMAVQYIAPDSFTFYLSAFILVGLVVGGVGWLPGAFFGAVFVLIVPNLAETVSKGLSGAVYGAFLIALIFFLPSGASTFRDLLSNRIRRKTGISN